MQITGPSHPAGSVSRVKWMPNTAVGNRSSSTLIGDMTTPSTISGVAVGICSVGAPTRLDVRIRPVSAKSVISRNSRNRST